MLRSTSMLTAGLILSVTAALAAASPESIADAAMRGDRADELAMIKQGADVNAPQGDGVTALHWASRHGEAEIVQAPIAAGRDAPEAPGPGRRTPRPSPAQPGERPSGEALLAPVA